MGTAITLSDRDHALIRRTVAKDLADDPAGFDHFIHMCKHYGLDPLRRQIYAFVFHKDDVKKRSITFVTAIDGYRAIADRTGNYRPGDRSVVVDPSARDAKTNPIGVISATATVFKFSHGEWHSFSETVYWEEFAPLKEVWRDNKPTGEFILDPKKDGWRKMPRVMLQKCSEAQALRRGWPDDLSGLYVEEELDRASIDITPTERANAAESEARQALLGGPAIIVDWVDGEALASVPVGKFGDTVLAFVKQHAEDDPDRIGMFAERNVEALRQYWGHDKDGALTVKKALAPYLAVRERQNQLHAAE